MSRLCAELDRGVRTFRKRRLDEQRYPYVWLDAMAENVREGGRIILMEFLVTVAVNERGDREILGCEVRSGETEAIWTAFLRSVLARALTASGSSPPTPMSGCERRSGRPSTGATWQR